MVKTNDKKVALEQEAKYAQEATETEAEDINGHAADADDANELTGSKVFADGAEVSGTTEQTTADRKMLPTPVFICTDDATVITNLEATLSDKYEICVLNAEMLAKSKRLWFLGKMGEEERNRVIELQYTEEKRQQALALVMELGNVYGFGMEGGKPFRQYDMKNYFTKSRKSSTGGKQPNVSFSSKDVRNLIDIFTVFNFITSPDPTVNYEKRDFYITVTDTDRLPILQAQHESMERERAAIELLMLDNQSAMDKITKSMEEASKQLDEAEISAPPTKRKARNDKGKEAEADSTSKPKRRTKRTAQGAGEQ